MSCSLNIRTKFNEVLFSKAKKAKHFTVINGDYDPKSESYLRIRVNNDPNNSLKEHFKAEGEINLMIYNTCIEIGQKDLTKDLYLRSLLFDPDKIVTDTWDIKFPDHLLNRLEEAEEVQKIQEELTSDNSEVPDNSEVSDNSEIRPEYYGYQENPPIYDYEVDHEEYWNRMLKVEEEVYEQMNKQNHEDYIPVDFDTLNDAITELYNSEKSENYKPSVYQTTLTGYLHYQHSVLKQLEINYEIQKISNPDSEKIERYKNAISKISKEIKDLSSRVTSIEELIKTIEDNIKYLSDLVDHMTLTNINLENLLFRIDGLSKVIEGVDMYGRRIEGQESFFELFASDKKIIRNIRELSGSLRELIGRYNKRIDSFLFELVKESPLLNKHIKSGKITMEKVEEMLGIFREKKQKERIKGKSYLWQRDVDVSDVSGFIGMDTRNDFVGQILMERFNNNINNFRGRILHKLELIEELRKKVKKSIPKFSENMLRQSYMFSGRKFHHNILISKYSDEFLAIRKEIDELKNKFEKRSTDSKYKRWQNKVKGNIQFFDITLIPSIYEKYKDHPEYSEYFTEYDEEKSREQEERLIKAFGKLFYDDLVLQQENAIDEYVDYVMQIRMDLSLDQREKEVIIFQNNPFEYLKHFSDKEKYNSSVEKTFTITHIEDDDTETEKKVTISNIFLSDKFLIIMPDVSKSKFFNPEFSIIENNEDFFNLWKTLHDVLTNFINATYTRMGHSVQPTDLPYIPSIAKNEMALSLNWLKRIPPGTEWFFKDFYERFASKTYQNLDKKTTDIVSEYEDTSRKQEQTLIELFKRRSYDDLVELSEGLGLDNVVVDLPDELADNDALSKQIHEQLATNLAHIIIYSNVRVNFIDNINALAHKTALTNARMETYAIGIMVQQYLERHAENEGVIDYYKQWIEVNLKGDSLAGARKSSSRRMWMHQMGLLPKIYSNYEKELKLFYKNELKSPHIPNKFTYNDITYFAVKNEKGVVISYRDHDGYEVDLKEARKIYLYYIKERLENLGVIPTLASVISGLNFMRVAAVLGLNPSSAFGNRAAGRNQIALIAATEMYGFNETELSRADRFLSFYNFKKLTKIDVPLSELNKKALKKRLQVQTYEKLLRRFNILQDRANEAGVIKKDHDIFFDLTSLAITFQERWNQGEAILSYLQTVKIKDKDGNIYTVFDGKRQLFPMFEPGTLKLKEEFRTEENISAWEKFDMGTESLMALEAIKTIITRANGNYSLENKPPYFSKIWVQLAGTFKKYFPNYMNRQYGTHQFDLVTGEENLNGYKRALWKDAPALFIYFISSVYINWNQKLLLLSLGTIFFSPIWTLIFISIFAVPTVGKLLALLCKCRLRKQMKEIHNTFSDSCVFLTDMLLRSISTSINRTLLLKPNALMKRDPITDVARMVKDKHIDSKIKRANRKREKEGEELLSKEEMRAITRQEKILSANTQEIANQVSILVRVASYYLLLETVIEFLTKRKCTEEEIKNGTCDQKVEKKIEYYNGIFIYMTNINNNLSREASQVTNVFDIHNILTQMQILQYVKDVKKFGDDIMNYTIYEKSFNVFGDIGKVIPLPAFPQSMTSNISNTYHLIKGDYLKLPVGHDRIWGETALYDHILGDSKEEMYKKVYTNMRKAYKEDISIQLKHDIDIIQDALESGKTKEIQKELDKYHGKNIMHADTLLKNYSGSKFKDMSPSDISEFVEERAEKILREEYFQKKPNEDGIVKETYVDAVERIKKGLEKNSITKESFSLFKNYYEPKEEKKPKKE